MGRSTAILKVTLFTAATGIAAVGIFRFIEKRPGSAGGYVVYALFNDGVGIAKHSQVRVAGIPVGNIEGVRLDHGKARIDIRVEKGVPLHTDASVAKVSSSLLGEYYLSIAPGTEGSPQLQDGDQIPNVMEGVTTDNLMKSLAEISKDVQRVSHSLAESVGTNEGQENMRKTLENLAQVTQALNETVRENRETIRDILLRVDAIAAKSQPQIDRILENVQNATSDVREMMTRTEGEGQGQGQGQKTGEVREILDKINRASTSLENTMANLDSVTGRLDKGQGTLGRLSKDEKLINEVEGVTETVGDFVGGLGRLQTIVQLRSDYQFLASTVKNYVQLRLQPREDKYYAIEIISDPKGLTHIEQTTVNTTNPNQPETYFEKRQTTTNSFRFSLQIAQRVGPFWGRFGIKESTGGIGLDTMLLDDRFEIQQDLFGFGETVLPRWRLSLNYNFMSRLWFLAGIDDIFSATRRDYFVGMQLRFNDEDLKTILPFAKTP
jgi:phospholipid/cholesterol/gamma-HCH transport system substrate-binding protein